MCPFQIVLKVATGHQFRFMMVEGPEQSSLSQDLNDDKCNRTLSGKRGFIVGRNFSVKAAMVFIVCLCSGDRPICLDKKKSSVQIMGDTRQILWCLLLFHFLEKQ